jgi:hypothetical protein
MLKRIMIMLALVLPSVAMAVGGGTRIPKIPTPSLVERRSFMWTVRAALVAAETEQQQKDPSYVAHDIAAGLVKGEPTEGMIQIELCEDPSFRQVLMRAFNRPDAESKVRELGFTKIYCKGTQYIYTVFPAKRVKPEEKPEEVETSN